MENEAKQTVLPVQPPPQTAPLVPPSPNWSKILLTTVLGLIIVVGSVFIGMQIGENQTPSQQPIVAQPTALPTQLVIQPTEEPTMNPQINIPKNWTTTIGNKCNIKFATPPLTGDTENRRWTLESESTSDFVGFFKGSSDRFIHRNQVEASGYISGMVSVICGRNTTNTTTEKLFSDFHTFLGVEATKASVSEAVVELTSANDSTLWETQVKQFTLVGGMFDPNQKYYLFVNNTNWYLVTQKSNSASKEINDQTNQIFSLLTFVK